MMKPTGSKHRSYATTCLALVCMLGGITGCGDDLPSFPPPSPTVLPTPQPTTPDNLIELLEMTYNDKVRDASARMVLYEDLFPPANHDSLSFIFFFQPVDVEPGAEPSWGLAGELEAHRNMFSAQDARDIFSLDLNIVRLEPQAIELPQPGQETWVEIFGTNIMVRLMFNPQDGLLVDGGQAKFLLAPADDRWYMTEWTDLPRPEPRDDEGEPSSWGALKNLYR